MFDTRNGRSGEGGEGCKPALCSTASTSSEGALPADAALIRAKKKKTNGVNCFSVSDCFAANDGVQVSCNFLSLKLDLQVVSLIRAHTNRSFLASRLIANTVPHLCCCSMKLTPLSPLLEFIYKAELRAHALLCIHRLLHSLQLLNLSSPVNVRRLL